MNAKAFIEDLQRKGVEIWVENGAIKYRGPSEVLTQEMINILKDKKREIVKEKTVTKVRGYGCAGCGSKIYQAVEVWETREILEPSSSWGQEHEPVTHWQCEGCGAVFEIINGTTGSQNLN
jgi:hypothetical protein